jgi:pimeloyl-ACP methyl ester carboxylesterase
MRIVALRQRERHPKLRHIARRPVQHDQDISQAHEGLLSTIGLTYTVWTNQLALALIWVKTTIARGEQEFLMPVLTRPDGEIHYEVTGAGFPVLLFAPGGLRSRMEMWHPIPGGAPRPVVDWTEALPKAGFTAIAMDQRNAGASIAAIEADHGWDTYTQDHLALMDHLGFDKFHVLGGCIGGSFCLNAIKLAPTRIASAVLQNPIGLHPVHTNYFPDGHAEWSRDHLAARPELDPAALEAFGRNMWGQDFVFCVNREFVRHLSVPCMLLPGSDTPHPAETSAEIAALLPGVEVLPEWRAPAHGAQQESAVVAFLKAHTPAA